MERLARGDTVDQGIVQRAFQYSGTKIITPTKTYNPNNEFDEEYFEFGLFMSRREYKTIRRRMRAGVTAAVKEGKWPFNQAPYGWQRVKLEHGRGWVLAPDPDEAPVVKLIFRLYTGPDRIGITHICRYLDNRGIKPRNGDTWLECSVMGILRNVVNDQRVGIGRRKVVKQVQNGSVSKVRPHSDYDFTAPGLQPRLIDHDVFLGSAGVSRQELSQAAGVLRHKESSCRDSGLLLLRKENAEDRLPGTALPEDVHMTF